MVPSDLRFTKEHEWVRIDGEEATVGITEFAAHELGDVVFVELPAVGTQLEQHATFGVVESVKAVSDLFAPLSGEVTAINEALGQTLDLIIPERLRARHWDGYQRVMETGHTDYGDRLLEVPALHRDGHTISIAFTVTLLAQPGERQPYAIVALMRDDTARRAELKDARERVAALEAQGRSSTTRR